MNLSPDEKEKLLIFTAALVAERRKEKGLKLNHTEATALLCAAILEGAREGCTETEVIASSYTVLDREAVMEGVPEMIEQIQIEATFADGIKLITVPNPIA